MKLKELLQLNGLHNDQVAMRFKEIANELMNKWCIKKDSTYYELVEIEFYLYSDNHKDEITYKRPTTPAGYWHFHDSGVDINFESNDDCYGGILIRGIRQIGTDNYIFGPKKCEWEVWQDFNAFDAGPCLVPTSIIEDMELAETERYITSEKYRNADYLHAKYRYYKESITNANAQGYVAKIIP